MNYVAKNKVLTWLVVLLMLFNTASIAMFWLGRTKPRRASEETEQPRGKPQDFLVKELNLDTVQQVQLEILTNEHRVAIKEFHEAIKDAKQNFFNLLKEQNTPDSIKQTAAAGISRITEKIDLLTFAHFKKVRALCNVEQQKKFDKIIQQIIEMMGEQRRVGGPNRPPPDDPNGDNHPPQDDQKGNRPPTEK